MQQYYVGKPGFAQEGPYPAATIYASYLQGAYPPGTMVWNEEMPQWLPVDEVFAAAAPSTPEAPAATEPEQVEYFIAEPGRVPHGPHSLAEIQARCQQAAYPEGTRIWSNISAGWAPIESVIPTTPAEPAPAPEPTPAPAPVAEPVIPVVPVVSAYAPQSPAPTAAAMPPAPVVQDAEIPVAEAPAPQPYYTPAPQPYAPVPQTYAPALSPVTPVQPQPAEEEAAETEDEPETAAPRVLRLGNEWNILTAFISCLKRYTQINGRASRAEFWYFELAKFILLIPAILLLLAESPAARIAGSIYVCVHVLGLLAPSLTVQIRRLHDIALSGWFLFLYLIPYLGNIICLVLFCLPGKGRGNKHGAAPLPPA